MSEIVSNIKCAFYNYFSKDFYNFCHFYCESPTNLHLNNRSANPFLFSFIIFFLHLYKWAYPETSSLASQPPLLNLGTQVKVASMLFWKPGWAP